MPYIDHSVFPDCEDPPHTLDTAEAKADYVHRVCSAWDFHILPEPETFCLFAQWKDVFDRFPLIASPAYHAFRAWFGWQPLAIPATLSRPTQLYRVLDAKEGRAEDPCEQMI